MSLGLEKLKKKKMLIFNLKKLAISSNHKKNKKAVYNIYKMLLSLN